MEDKLADLKIGQVKLEEKAKQHDEKFLDISSVINRFKDDVAGDITEMKENMIRQRESIDKIVWQVFFLITVPILILIVTVFFKK